jgi:outer membrane protein assembly factor BamD
LGIFIIHNLLEDFLGTKYKEEAIYYSFKAGHDFVLKSYDRRKLERISDATEDYERLIKSFPESKYLEDANEMFATLQKEKIRVDALVAKQAALVANLQKK